MRKKVVAELEQRVCESYFTCDSCFYFEHEFCSCPDTNCYWGLVGSYEASDISIYRPFVRWIAGRLELNLRKNESGESKQRSKGPWETDSLTNLVDHWEREIVEVRDAMSNNGHSLCCEENRTYEALEAYKAELMDVIATSSMIIARLDPEMSQMRRGDLP